MDICINRSFTTVLDGGPCFFNNNLNKLFSLLFSSKTSHSSTPNNRITSLWMYNSRIPGLDCLFGRALALIIDQPSGKSPPPTDQSRSPPRMTVMFFARFPHLIRSLISLDWDLTDPSPTPLSRTFLGEMRGGRCVFNRLFHGSQSI